MASPDPYQRYFDEIDELEAVEKQRIGAERLQQLYDDGWKVGLNVKHELLKKKRSIADVRAEIANRTAKGGYDGSENVVDLVDCPFCPKPLKVTKEEAVKYMGKSVHKECALRALAGEKPPFSN